MQDSDEQAQALSQLSQALAQAHRWEEAERVISTIQDSDGQAWALGELAEALGQAHRWEEAERVISSIRQSDEQVWALAKLADTLAQSNEYERLLPLVRYWWQRVRRRDEAVCLLALAYGFLSYHSELGIAFFDAFAWVDEFLRG
ncbi:MAG: hypothetical protein JO125_04390 [Chloroflexi bacterium]|nr:hypothetical protein [Chloroflexota bacterium]